MMTPEQLKNSILQRAIEGKLVPCDLSKWKQVELGTIVTKKIKRGKSPKYVPKSNTMVFAQKCNAKDGRIDMSLAYFLDESKLQNYDEQEFMCNDDIVINSTGTGTMGRVGIFNDKDRIDNMQVVPDSHVTVIRVNGDCSAKFIFYVLKNSQKVFEKNGDGSTNQKELKAAFLNSYLFNLPPLAEQKRIVAKLEELLPLVDEYAKAYNQLQTLNAKFPGDLKKSLLQYAIEGKLVPQIASEGTGGDLLAEIKKEKAKLIKEGKLKKQKELLLITEDEKPFAIPDSWEWVKFGEIVNYSMGKTPPRAEPEWWGKDFPWVSIADMTDNGHITNTKECVSRKAIENKFINKVSKAGTLLMSFKLTVGRVSILDIDAVHNEAIISIYPLCDSENIMQMYLFNILPMLTNLGDTKDAIKGKTLNDTSIKNLLIPLPPLAEQKRIVAKLEELLPLCDELK